MGMNEALEQCGMRRSMTQTRATRHCLSLGLSFAAVLLSLWSPIAVAADCVPATQDDFIDALEQWNINAATGHPDKMTRLYAQHGTFVPGNGTEPRIGYDAIRHHFVYALQNQPQLKVLTRDIRIGCEIAIDSGTYVLTTGPGNTRQSQTYRYSLIYTRYNNAWLIEHHHASLLISDPIGDPSSKKVRSPAVAGFILRAPEKVKSTPRPARVPTSSAAKDFDYRPGTWVGATPVFED
jgi:uncharacterized protein (TIGR02246 family)